MKKNKVWAVIIYVIFLLTISLILVTVIFDSFVLLKNENDINSIESDLYLDMTEKFIISTESSNYYNSNWSWFIDVISCPTNISMSWTVNNAIVSTELTSSWWLVFCSWSYLWDNFQIFFDDTITDLSWALYEWSSVVLNVWTQVNTFSDPDNTIIDITASAYNFPDSLDDNMNSDEFLPSSWIWNVAYPNYYQDDDALWRMELNGYVNELDFKNIFWSNSKVSEYIDNNANNYEWLNTRLWIVDDALMYLAVNTWSTLKILEINKSSYDSNRLIVIDNTYSWSIVSWSWYIQNNAWSLSLSPLKTGNEHIFDFTAKDYSIFLQNTSSWVLKYNLKSETGTWRQIYIVPLNDSSPNEISFLWNNMLEQNGVYIWKTQELKKYLKFWDWADSSYVVTNYLTWKRRSDWTYAKTCNEYRFPDLWADYKYLWSTWDWNYWLNPGWMAPFLAECDMTWWWWTKALINNWTRFQVVGIDDFTLLNTFTYDLSQVQISAIKWLSSQFRQHFSKECYRSIVYDANASNQVKWRSFWTSLLSWNYFPNYNICDGGNDDPILPVTWLESAGNSFTWSFLPITEIWWGDTWAESPPWTSSEDSYYTFWDFYMR